MVYGRIDERKSQAPCAIVHYTVRLDDGTILDRSEEGNPLVFTFGGHEVLPRIEEVLRGMNPGETREIRISFEEMVLASIRFLLIYAGGGDFQGWEGREAQRVDRPWADLLPSFHGGAPLIQSGGMEGMPEHPLAGREMIFEITLLDLVNGEWQE